MLTSYHRRLHNIQACIDRATKQDRDTIQLLSTKTGQTNTTLPRPLKRRRVRYIKPVEVVISEEQKTINQQIDAANKRIDAENEPMRTYLLDCAPFLAEYALMKTQNMSTLDVTDEFQLFFGCETVRRKKMKRCLLSSSCSNCNKDKCLVMVKNEATYVCTHCGNATRYGIAEGVDAITHEDRMRLPSPPYTYKPLQHFIDLLSQVEGKTTRIVPNEVYMELRLRFRKTRIPLQEVTALMIRQMLRKINKCKYYEDIYCITKRLNPDFKTIVIPDKRKDILKNMFREVYPRFKRNAKHVLRTRKNFLSYPYVAFKFCELCDWDEYMHVFSLLKSREKLRKQDLILSRIFAELAWQWIPTI